MNLQASQTIWVIRLSLAGSRWVARIRVRTGGEKLQILDLDPADEGLSRRVVTPSVCEPGYTSFCTARRETATGGQKFV